jgi:DNA (cytosine-5)-methyltransferase 1
MRDLTSLLTMSMTETQIPLLPPEDSNFDASVKLDHPIQIVDLFAGPGGLGEGFASSGDGKRFEILVSAEAEPLARKTLKLRAFYRLLKRKNPSRLKDYYDYCNGKAEKPYSVESEAQWNEAEREARQIKLGTQEGDYELDKILDEHLDSNRPWVLIGGPPCQAYSMAGRARNQSKANYKAEEDDRHFLYKEYLRIIKERQPTVFVMENVKGILSSKIGEERIFSQILKDLSNPHKALGEKSSGKRYRICSLVTRQSYEADEDVEKVDPHAFVIRSERFGIPQARHRVILLGVAVDEKDINHSHALLNSVTERVSVGDVLRGLPKIRSRLSRRADDTDAWYDEVIRQLDELRSEVGERAEQMLSKRMDIARYTLESRSLEVGSLRVPRAKDDGKTGSHLLDDWYRDPNLEYWLNHDARGHMPSDLRRYIFAATFAQAHKTSPKGHLQFFLSGLAPAHKNWETGKFSDRFRVQLEDQPATTITSHLSKDGHYFIHYDPCQCRSLTVREAARLQSFPDNYFFEGNRSQQFQQVGNAVPPLLASKIASIVYHVVSQRVPTGLKESK